MQTDVKRRRDLTGSRESISVIISLGRAAIFSQAHTSYLSSNENYMSEIKKLKYVGLLINHNDNDESSIPQLTSLRSEEEGG